MHLSAENIPSSSRQREQEKQESSRVQNPFVPVGVSPETLLLLLYYSVLHIGCHHRPTLFQVDKENL